MRRAAIVVVVAGAAALRFWGLFQGLPFTMSRPDEVEMLRQTAAFPSGDLNPRWFVYPNLFFWVSWLWIEGVLAVRRLVVPTPEYQDLLATQMATLVGYGRVLSALVGTATVAVVYGIGRRLGGTTLGLVAAVLLATNYLHVRDSHGLKADVYLTIALLPALWLLAGWVRSGTLGDAVRAGIATGIATGLKYPGVLVMITALQGDWLRQSAATWKAYRPSAGLWLFGAVTTVVFLCASPFLLVDPERLEWTFTTSVGLVYGPGRSGFTPGPGASWWEHVWSWIANRSFVYHAAVSLRWGCGLAVAVLTPIACWRAWRERTEAFWPLCAGFVVVYYVVIGLSQVTLARYFTPVTPLLALLCGALLVEMTGRVRAVGARRIVLVLAVLAITAEPTMRAVAHDRVAARTDTRVLATEWMDAHLAPDAVVAVLGSLAFPIADPDVPAPRTRADVPLGATDLEARGVTHVVVHEHRQLWQFSNPIRAQIDALAPRLSLLAEFSPYASQPAGWFEELDAYYIPFHDFRGVERPGPDIRIYALGAEGSAS